MEKLGSYTLAAYETKNMTQAVAEAGYVPKVGDTVICYYLGMDGVSENYQSICVMSAENSWVYSLIQDKNQRFGSYPCISSASSYSTNVNVYYWSR